MFTDLSYCRRWCQGNPPARPGPEWWYPSDYQYASAANRTGVHERYRLFRLALKFSHEQHTHIAEPIIRKPLAKKVFCEPAEWRLMIT